MVTVYISVLSLVASILTLTVIACDRFFGIVFAVKAMVTVRRSKLMILLIWTLSIAISLPLLIYRKQFSRQWANHLEVWCDDEWPVFLHDTNVVNITMSPYPSTRKVYYTTVSLVLYFIPCVVMTVAYGIIIHTLRATKLPGEHIGSMAHAQQRKKKKV